MQIWHRGRLTFRRRRLFWFLCFVLGSAGLFGCPKNEPVQTRRDNIWDVLRQARSSQASKRKEAVAALGRLGSVKSVQSLPVLRKALKDPDAGVRREAVSSLRKLGSKATPTLIEAATSRDKVVRLEARRALSLSSDQVAILQRALEHPFWRVRQSAAILLGEMKKESVLAVLELAKTLRDKEADVRIAAAKALRLIGPPEAAQPSVVKALGKALLSNRSWWRVRIAMAHTLATFQAKGALAGPALISLLDDKDKKVQKAGAKALEAIGVAALPALQTALSGSTWQAKIWITRIFQSMGPKAKPAIPAMVDALGDNDLDVRKAALLALQSLGKSAVSAMPKLLGMIKATDTPRALWEGSLQCIFSIGTQGNLGLLSLLESNDWTLRRRIMENIGRLGAKVGPQAVPFLTQALSHKQKEVRWTSAMVLSKLGPRSATAVTSLAQALNDKDPITRKWAARALAAIGKPARSAIPALLQRKKDPNPDVRNAVAQAIQTLK